MITMMVKDEKTIELDMVGEVTAEDYRTVRPQLENIFSKHGKMKFLINTDAVTNFSLGAVYEDIKFDLQHLKFIGTTAIVSSKKTFDYLTKAIDKIFPAKVQHFENQNQAELWLGTES